MIKLDVGCGSSKKAGFIGMDILNFENVDIVHDLGCYPWPFKDNEVEELIMDNVLEHLERPLKVIEEVYRISSNNCTLKITVPYFRSIYAFIDPTHVNFFSLHWFDYFDKSKSLANKYAYSSCHLRIEKKTVHFSYSKFNIIGMLISMYANKFPESYEYRLSRYFPADYIVFDLTVIK